MARIVVDMICHRDEHRRFRVVHKPDRRALFVTIALFLFSLVSCDRSAGGVFFEPYMAPRITAWRGRR